MVNMANIAWWFNFLSFLDPAINEPVALDDIEVGVEEAYTLDPSRMGAGP